MSNLWIEMESWLPAGLLAAAMLAAWRISWWRGRRSHKKGQEKIESKFNDAVLALLGLLLAFTFSMSLIKHDQRRQMAVTDSNAIGDFYTCVSLLEEPVRGQLQSVVRRYVEHRLGLAESFADEDSFERRLDEIQEMQAEMQTLVGRAVDEGTPLVVPLVNTLNGVTSSHAARLMAFRDRLPFSVLLLLFLGAVISMTLLGRHQGVSNEWRLGRAIGFTVLVCLAVWVTLDLNQPQKGLITVSQEPLERLLRGMQG